jgi:hypothetical protein
MKDLSEVKSVIGSVVQMLLENGWWHSSALC